MKTSDYDYELPQELIAQTPVEPRDSSRLMEVWLRLSDRNRLEEYLLDMDSVAKVRMHESDLEVDLAYPTEQFVPDGSDGAEVVESRALGRSRRQRRS